jgi:hypothetical protein
MSVVEEVKAEVEKVVEEVKKVEDRVRIDLEDGEKFVVTKLENDFLKAQVELQQIEARAKHLREVAQNVSKAYTTKLEELAKKYEISLKEFFYNAVETAFMKNQTPPPQPPAQG